MKFFLLLFCLFLIPQKSVAQKNAEEHNYGKVRRYVSLKHLEEKGIQVASRDTIDFVVHDKDTLVLITPYLEQYFPEGQKVRIKPQDSTFIREYITAVYGSKRNKERERQSNKIWRDTIRIYFDSSVPRRHQKDLLRFAENIDSEVDSLRIKKVSHLKDANYLVFYKNRENDFDLDPRITNTKSGYYLNWEQNRYFTRASLKVNSYNYTNEEQLLQDLKKRFFQTLGYFHDGSSFVCGSYLSNCWEVRGMSPKDLEILKYHYSFQNCYGIGFEEFECQQELRRKKFAEHPGILMYVSHPK